jgi:hypothetical protein
MLIPGYITHGDDMEGWMTCGHCGCLWSDIDGLHEHKIKLLWGSTCVSLGTHGHGRPCQIGVGVTTIDQSSASRKALSMVDIYQAKHGAVFRVWSRDSERRAGQGYRDAPSGRNTQHQGFGQTRMRSPAAYAAKCNVICM